MKLVLAKTVLKVAAAVDARMVVAAAADVPPVAAHAAGTKNF